MELEQYSKTERTNAIFQRYDSNKDGFMSIIEIKAILMDAGYPNIADNDVKWIYSAMDSNQDGNVSWIEIYNFMK